MTAATDATDEYRCVINTDCTPKNCGSCVSGNNNRCGTCMPGFFDAIGECFRCDFSCNKCSLDTTAGGAPGTFKAALKADGDAKLATEADKIYDSGATSFYAAQSLYLLDLWLTELKKITELNSDTKIVAVYKAKFITFDTSSYASIKTSATNIYNALTGSTLTEDQFFLKTLKLAKAGNDIQCSNCVKQYGLDSNDKKCKPCKDYCLTCTYTSNSQTCSAC